MKIGKIRERTTSCVRIPALRHESVSLVFQSDTHRLVVDGSNNQMRLFERTTRDDKPFLKLIKEIDIEEIEV